MKKVFVKSYGCQMNVYDAQRMADVLAGEGFSETDAMEEADLVILNTCHIREKAAEKVYSELGRVKALKRERAAQGVKTRVVVAGCVAQAEGQEIIRRAPVVDIVVGPQSYHRLPQLLKQAERDERAVDTEFPVEDKFDHLPAPARAVTRSRGVSAFLTIQEGCDKFCSFCVVPYTRGAEVSRPVAKILQEARRLTQAGVREITLIGQNVNAYHGEGEDGSVWALGRLIRRLAEEPGLERIRYTTSHPRDMDDDLIATHRDCPALMPFLHLPVQSGSDRILDAMKRKHTADTYRAVIEKVRAARPDIALSSISSSASPARRMPILPRRCGSSRTCALRAPSRSNTARGRAHRRPRWLTRCPNRSKRSGSRASRNFSRRSVRTSTAKPWGERWTYSWKSRAGTPGRSQASRPICKPCRSTDRGT